MGRYMRKEKLSGEVAVMEVSHQSSLGVRTRARAFAALQKPGAPDASLAYLELRSRRLEKPLPPSSCSRQPKDSSKHSLGPGGDKASAGSISLRRCSKRDESASPGTEKASFGENALESKMTERETMPCSPIRDSQTASAAIPPRSTLTDRRIQNPLHVSSPTALEIEEFFASAEQMQQRSFMEKYNFDPVNDNPLPGRYDWVKLDY